MIALVYLAIEDKSCRQCSCEDGLELFVDALYEIQCGYNLNAENKHDEEDDDRPICASGCIFKEFGAAFEGRNDDDFVGLIDVGKCVVLGDLDKTLGVEAPRNDGGGSAGGGSGSGLAPTLFFREIPHGDVWNRDVDEADFLREFKLDSSDLDLDYTSFVP